MVRELSNQEKIKIGPPPYNIVRWRGDYGIKTHLMNYEE